MKPVAEDDLEPLVTECPSCRTRFRVAETQLQSARGRVRCGACLTVFNGVEHLIWDEVETFASDEEAQNALDDLLNELEEAVIQPTGLPAEAETLPSGNAIDEPELPHSAAFVGEEPTPPQELSAVESESAGLVFEPVEDQEQKVKAEEAEAIIELIEEHPPLRDQDLADDRPPQSLRNVVPIFSGFEEDDQPTEDVEAEKPDSPVTQDIVTDVPGTLDIVEENPDLVETARVSDSGASPPGSEVGGGRHRRTGARDARGNPGRGSCSEGVGYRRCRGGVGSLWRAIETPPVGVAGDRGCGGGHLGADSLVPV